jgi:two-component system, OmpR family, sensor histidine kinase TorS
MGLGLTISKMIVTQLGGEIGVWSQPDLGSRFSFSIPIEHFEHMDASKKKRLS